MSLTKAKERVTSTCRCGRVSVQRYSVQYKEYNLIGVTSVEGGATRGRQHWFIDSYIAAYIQVQYRVIGVHPTGLTVARGVSRCRQLPLVAGPPPPQLERSSWGEGGSRGGGEHTMHTERESGAV
jgi:hypothetical protein